LQVNAKTVSDAVYIAVCIKAAHVAHRGKSRAGIDSRKRIRWTISEPYWVTGELVLVDVVDEVTVGVPDVAVGFVVVVELGSIVVELGFVVVVGVVGFVGGVVGFVGHVVEFVDHVVGFVGHVVGLVGHVVGFVCHVVGFVAHVVCANSARWYLFTCRSITGCISDSLDETRNPIY
jgi:hypothetical protein